MYFCVVHKELIKGNSIYWRRGSAEVLPIATILAQAQYRCGSARQWSYPYRLKRFSTCGEGETK
jgi:hypothetical protein